MFNRRFIGDVHGKFGRYNDILSKSTTPTIQVGDFGTGFTDPSHIPRHSMIMGGHRYVRGNHDNPDLCKKDDLCITDGTTEVLSNGVRIMYIGGAWSIDYAHRQTGINWWPDEELTIPELDKIVDDYIDFKPDVVISHDCPQDVSYELFLKDTSRPIYKTRTGQALGIMWSSFKPKLWIFGHWHESKQEILQTTKFVCLNELETYDVDLTKYKK